MHMSVADYSMNKSNLVENNIFLEKWNFLLYNFMKYKIFILATYQTVLFTVLLLVYGKMLIWVESSPTWTCVTTI
jgi:hypothetical protein